MSYTVFLRFTSTLVLLVSTTAVAGGQTPLERLIEKGECRSCDLSDTDLAGRNLAKVVLEKTNLQGAKLVQPFLETV